MKQHAAAILMFLLGLVIELGAPVFLRKSKLRRLVQILGIMAILMAVFWIGILVGEKEPSSIDIITTPAHNSVLEPYQEEPVAKTIENQAGGVVIGVLGDANTVGDINVQTTSAPSLSEENLGQILGELVPQYNERYGIRSKIVRPNYHKPVLFIMYDLNQRLYFKVVQNEREQWQTIWEFGTPDKFYDGFGRLDVIQDRYVVWHSSGTGIVYNNFWNFIVYDVITEEGWVIESLPSDPNSLQHHELNIPFGFPTDLSILFDFEQLFLEYVSWSGHLGNSSTDAYLAFPHKRIIPPSCNEFRLDCSSLFEFYQSLFDTNLTVNQIYRAEVNGDDSLEEVIYVSNRTEYTNSVYIRNEAGLLEIPIDGYEPMLYFGVYPSGQETPYIVIGGHLGASGNYGFIHVLQRSDDEYKLIGSDSVNDENHQFFFIREEFGVFGSKEKCLQVNGVKKCPTFIFYPHLLR